MTVDLEVSLYSLSLSHVELTASIRCSPKCGPGNQTMCFCKLEYTGIHITWSHQNGSINVVVIVTFIVVVFYCCPSIPTITSSCGLTMNPLATVYVADMG